MPDPAPAPDVKPQTTLQQVRDVLLAIAAVITAISSPIIILKGNMHAADVKSEFHAGTAAIQTQVDDKAAIIVKKQETAAKTATEVKQTLEAVKTEDTRSTAMNLYGTWKTLEWLADNSGLQSDIDKAKEAQKLYAEYMKKHPH